MEALSPAKAKKPAKPAEIVTITASYEKADGTSSNRKLFTVDKPAVNYIRALDVSSLSPDQSNNVLDAYRGYQTAYAEHMSQFPTVEAWMTARGIEGVGVKSFKVTGLKDAEFKVAEFK